MLGISLSRKVAMSMTNLNILSLNSNANMIGTEIKWFYKFNLSQVNLKRIRSIDTVIGVCVETGVVGGDEGVQLITI